MVLCWVGSLGGFGVRIEKVFNDIDDAKRPAAEFDTGNAVDQEAVWTLVAAKS